MGVGANAGAGVTMGVWTYGWMQVGRYWSGRI